jgi:hypothetical protein
MTDPSPVYLKAYEAMIVAQRRQDIRARAAIAAMAAMLSKQGCRSEKVTAEDAMKYTDALITELEKVSP